MSCKLRAVSRHRRPPGAPSAGRGEPNCCQNGVVTECRENPLMGGRRGHLCMFSPRAPEMPGPPLCKLSGKVMAGDHESSV